MKQMREEDDEQIPEFVEVFRKHYWFNFNFIPEISHEWSYYTDAESFVRKQVLRHVCEKWFEIIVAWTWSLDQLILAFKVLPECDFASWTLDLSAFVLISSWARCLFIEFPVARVPTDWISTLSLEPGIVVILKGFVGLNNRKMYAWARYFHLL